MAQTVLITGASRGIGLATADYFARQGWNVAATSRYPASESLWGQPGNRITPRLDVTDEASIVSAIAATIQRFGSIDAVVNNAGYGLFGPLEGASAERLEAVFRTNVFGTANVIRQVLPHMRERGGGTIVNVSSVAGRVGTPFLSAYNATKFAIEGLSESLRFELRQHNIRVRIVEPGFFKSDFLTRGLEWSSHSAYEPAATNLKSWVYRSMRRAKDPMLVAEAIYDAVQDPTSRLRYKVGAGVLLLRALVPDSLWQWLMRQPLKKSPVARAARPAGTPVKAAFQEDRQN